MSTSARTSRPVYLNGRIVPAAEAALPVDDPATLHGFGFFETFRTSGGKPHHWDFNRARLARSCQIAQLALPLHFLAHDSSRLREVVSQLLALHGATDGVFRYTVTGAPAELLSFRPLPPPAPSDGIALRVLNLPRDSGEWIPRPKSCSYFNALLGARELQKRAVDPSDEGLYLSREPSSFADTQPTRFVVETPRQNVAWIEDGQLRFPDFALGALDGTCLAWVRQLGIPAASARATFEQLIKAEAVLVLNSVRGITPVRTIWDTADRLAAGPLASSLHPLLVSLRRQWIEALAATARS